jgi:hypothetical protein
MRMAHQRWDRKCLLDCSGKRCLCYGNITAESTIDFSWGITNEDRNRILMTQVIIDKRFVDHMWVEAAPFSSFQRGDRVRFEALVYPYKKGFGPHAINSFQLIDILNTQKVS